MLPPLVLGLSSFVLESRISDRDHQLLREWRQVLELAIGCTIDCILDPHAIALAGVVQPWFDREDRTGYDHIAAILLRWEAEILVDLQPQAVAEPVDVALLNREDAADGWVAARLEIGTDQILVWLGRRAGLQLIHHLRKCAQHMLVGQLKLGWRVADRERAGHVVVVAAAGLAREDVEDDRLAQLERRR